MTDVNFPQDFYLDDVGVWRLKKEKLAELEKPKPMTNEEWFCTLSTEEKAKWIERIMFIVRYREEVENGAYMQTITKKDYIEKWLKEIHK